MGGTYGDKTSQLCKKARDLLLICLEAGSQCLDYRAKVALNPRRGHARQFCRVTRVVKLRLRGTFDKPEKGKQVLLPLATNGCFEAAGGNLRRYPAREPASRRQRLVRSRQRDGPGYPGAESVRLANSGTRWREPLRIPDASGRRVTSRKAIDTLSAMF